MPLASPSGPLPADIAMTTTLDGQTVPYIVRWERGTINRFVYSVAMLAPTTETDPRQPDDSLWNGRLVFSLEGGVAIGRTQGTSGTGAMLRHDVLQLGYAVVTSTGLRTNTHYNLQVGGETALMLKEHFIEDHGVPLYTVGVGGSGGAIQQYVYAQNHPGLLDAAIPQYSYSDMITQTIHVGDCELLEHYFDKTDRLNPKWKNVLNRRAIQGLNASVSPTISAGEAAQWNRIYSFYTLLGLNRPEPIPTSPTTPPPLTECRRAWFGLTPLVLNPTFTNVQDLDKLAQGTAGVDWTHAGDLVNIYGTDAEGFGAHAVGQRRRAVRPPGAARRRDHAGRVPRPQRQGGKLEGARRHGDRGLPVRRRAESRDLRPVELAQHEPVARRRRHAGGASHGELRGDQRRLRERHALRRRHRHPGDRLAPLSRGPARHAPQPPVVRHPPAPPAPRTTTTTR